jgi:hypothetical protein
MTIVLPTMQEVRAALAPLTMRQIDRLEALSGVPAPTIYKIKLGTTENPGVDTLRRFMPHVSVVLNEQAAPASDTKADA